MLLDANLLLYSVDRSSALHSQAARWLEDVLNGDQRVGIPWQSIGAFLRIITHPRVSINPLSGEEAMSYVTAWLDAEASWIPPATERTASVLSQLVAEQPVTGNLVPDALLAALAIEHGLILYSTDSDFARFRKLRWENPLR
ncbi:MAG TPA: TA system VapC family ribonuclease toxin [Acidimicrobiia bacterium]|nr:TA system VapC family ribonuclease toxin [Acidimicrobiia bacterium]